MKKVKKILIWLIQIILIVLVASAAYLYFFSLSAKFLYNKAVQIAQQGNKETVFKAKHSKLTVVFYYFVNNWSD